MGWLFTLTEDGDLTCRRSADGRAWWSEVISSNPCYASIVLIGGNLYVVDSDGVISVIAAAPVFRKISEYKLNEPVYATPAIAGGSIWVRTDQSLYCFR